MEATCQGSIAPLLPSIVPLLHSSTLIFFIQSRRAVDRSIRFELYFCTLGMFTIFIKAIFRSPLTNLLAVLLLILYSEASLRKLMSAFFGNQTCDLFNYRFCTNLSSSASAGFCFQCIFVGNQLFYLFYQGFRTIMQC